MPPALHPAPAHDRLPRRLPHGLFADIALRRGILLCLDYDGTLAEFTADAANAWPVDGVRQSIERIALAAEHASVAIVTGRRIADIMRFLGNDAPMRLSGLHGLEICDADGGMRFAPEVDECQPE